VEEDEPVQVCKLFGFDDFFFFFFFFFLLLFLLVFVGRRGLCATLQKLSFLRFEDAIAGCESPRAFSFFRLWS
jgi:hypothetical protein